jgi:hypothetical protein
MILIFTQASPIRMADKEVGIEAKRANSRGKRN